MQAAAEEVSARIGDIHDAEGRAELRLCEARLRVQLGETGASKALCWGLFDTNAAFDAAVLLAELAADEGDEVLALAFYERAVAINPTQKSTRFQLAYTASEADLPELSALHYGILERNGTATSVAINNLGASLEAGGARGLSRDYWKRASKMGSALAAGNLANAAANAGFLEEAQAFAEDASDEDESPRVGEALQRIARMRTEEQQIREDLERDGKMLSAALGSLIDSRDALSTPSGVWDVDGTEWEFELKDGGSEAKRGDRGEFSFATGGVVLRFEHKPSPYASARSGFALPAPNGDGLILVVESGRQSGDRLLRARPVPDVT